MTTGNNTVLDLNPDGKVDGLRRVYDVSKPLDTDAYLRYSMLEKANLAGVIAQRDYIIEQVKKEGGVAVAKLEHGTVWEENNGRIPNALEVVYIKAFDAFMEKTRFPKPYSQYRIY